MANEWSQQWADHGWRPTRTFSQPNQFAARNAGHLSTDVIGRSVEFSALAKFLQSAGVQSSGLVIEGEAGIGKTTLWLAAVEQAREQGFRVLPARIGQNETALAYAALADLLSDVDPAVLKRLPGVQRVAVDDVQWLDASSQVVVAYAVRRFKRRVGVLVTERVDAENGSASWLQLAKPDAVDRIRVGPLSLGGLHTLISTRLGQSPSRPSMRRI